jgi:hypothetical protein
VIFGHFSTIFFVLASQLWLGLRRFLVIFRKFSWILTDGGCRIFLFPDYFLRINAISAETGCLRPSGFPQSLFGFPQFFAFLFEYS